jgi:hypothetical protein
LSGYSGGAAPSEGGSETGPSANLADADADADALADAGLLVDAGLLASCKAIKDAGRSVGDGVYVIAGGLRVYCDMTLDDGGWLLIANVPLAPNGYWEYNASTRSITTPNTDLTTVGMLLPASVDALNVAYSEVLFTDTSSGNWFTVPSTSAFYLHNYQGTCGDSMVIHDTTFSDSHRSSGSGDLYANWANGCPNDIDSVLTQGTGCQAAFVVFDTSCAPGASAVRVRAYVR